MENGGKFMFEGRDRRTKDTFISVLFPDLCKCREFVVGEFFREINILL